MSNEIKVHYTSPGLIERIVQGLEAIGKSPRMVKKLIQSCGI